jgi:hypothetical protein
MKVWFGYGSEHSANLVIIGTFDSEDKARKAESLLNEVKKIAEQDAKAGSLKADTRNTQFSKAFLDFCSAKNFHWFNANDPAQFLFENKTQVLGKQVVIETEESEFSAFLKVMLDGGAKIEVYSAHDHPGSYGR